MSKLEMAHDYLKVLLTQNTSRTVGEAVETAYALADAMQAEADKRKVVGVPEAIRERHDFTPAINKGFERASQVEWQPDWSDAPRGDVIGWKMKTKEQAIWLAQDGGYYLAPSFNYQGNWQDSLRKRP